MFTDPQTNRHYTAEYHLGLIKLPHSTLETAILLTSKSILIETLSYNRFFSEAHITQREIKCSWMLLQTFPFYVDCDQSRCLIGQVRLVGLFSSDAILKIQRGVKGEVLSRGKNARKKKPKAKQKQKISGFYFQIPAKHGGWFLFQSMKIISVCAS